jgi:hypothetical protein
MSQRSQRRLDGRAELEHRVLEQQPAHVGQRELLEPHELEGLLRRIEAALGLDDEQHVDARVGMVPDEAARQDARLGEVVLGHDRAGGARHPPASALAGAQTSSGGASCSTRPRERRSTRSQKRARRSRSWLTMSSVVPARRSSDRRSMQRAWKASSPTASTSSMSSRSGAVWTAHAEAEARSHAAE